MRIAYFAGLLSGLIFIAQPSVATAQNHATTLSAAQRANYERAVQSFRARRFSDAYGRFVQLADAGHVPSAQLAWVMYRSGPTLFDSNWSAAPGQLQQWKALVISSMRDDVDSDDRGD